MSHNTWQVVLADWYGNTYPSIAAAHREVLDGASMTVTVARGNEIASQEQCYLDGDDGYPPAAVLYAQGQMLADQLNTGGAA